ncbi:alpha-E domain-containing protein [Novispirillum itersonii]|uniref:Putative alpha-E superfamily protein n=1 Tax=Novispirillum itersonii TaxID=189 RepID=A0A7W9ZE00_NOVIT|nr:alpha-E domain-containing protein [Novispirillum itersonii]MBB6208887.1 putative alpha-E superfamily protein [Novispirillum itersonii]
MLARAADTLFWMARYVERAEQTARVLEVSLRSAMLPHNQTVNEWEIPLSMTGTLDDYYRCHEDLSDGRVLSFMILERQNIASIRTSLYSARENARAARHLLTSELWESLNQSWLTIADMTWPDLTKKGVSEHLEWVRFRSHLFRGALQGSMLRSEGFHFARLGIAMERADNTARLLRARWDSLASDQNSRFGPDYYRATVLLEALSAFKAYREVYSARLELHKIADLLLLRPDMPRSLAYSVREIENTVTDLDPGSPVLREVRALRHRLDTVQVADLTRVGLTWFLDDMSTQLSALSTSLQRQFMMAQ